MMFALNEGLFSLDPAPGLAVLPGLLIWIGERRPLRGLGALRLVEGATFVGD